MDHTDLYIDGAWRPGSEGERFDVINPADETVLASVASATLDDADAALDAAQRAFGPWAARTPRERAEILRKAFELMSARRDHFARLITLENGKAGADARGEATYAAEFFRWFSEEAVRADGLVSRAPASGARILVQHKPAGIAVLVTPWNYPAANGFTAARIRPRRSRSAAAVMNQLSASETPLGPWLSAGVPAARGGPRCRPGVRQRGLPSAAARRDRRPHACTIRASGSVSFTLAPPAVGLTLPSVALPTGAQPAAMELGGNAPLLVLHDADIDVAVEGAMLAKMRNLGEACTAANRFYVHESVAEAFTTRFTEKMAALKVGDGLDPAVDVGPLVNADTRDKVAAFVDDAVAKGAKVRLGGRRPQGKGFFYPPTVLTDVPDNADCLRDEIFGPVAAIQTFTDEEDAIRRANDTEYGLVAYVFTQDMKRGLGVCERARLRHGGAQPRPRLGPGGALRRGEAVRARPRGRARGHAGVHGKPVHLGGLVRRRT